MELKAGKPWLLVTTALWLPSVVGLSQQWLCGEGLASTTNRLWAWVPGPSLSLGFLLSLFLGYVLRYGSTVDTDAASDCPGLIAGFCTKGREGAGGVLASSGSPSASFPFPHS